VGSQYIESGQVGQAWLRVRAHPLFPFQKSQMGKKNKVGAGEKRKESEGSPHFRLTQACARKFWSENFQSAQEVLWPQFSSALVREFALVTSDITSIEKEMDVDGDGRISLLEFNLFTAKDGLARALQKLMQAETLPPKRRASSQTSDTSAWLYVDAAPHARISTWQPGRSSYLDLSRVSRVPHLSFMPPCKRPRQWVHAVGSPNARAHAGIPSGVRHRRVTALFELDTLLYL